MTYIYKLCMEKCAVGKQTFLKIVAQCHQGLLPLAYRNQCYDRKIQSRRDID